MITEKLIDIIFGSFLSLLQSLPKVPDFVIPEGVKTTLGDLISCAGYFMPYSLYQPLFTFIIALVSFRIIYAIYLVITKRQVKL